MQRLFGLPLPQLAAVLLVVLAVAFGAVAVLAVRGRILATISVRNIARRRGRTALIVGGLMLGTAIITSALATGDTVSHTVRSDVVTSLGNVDELVSVQGVKADVTGVPGQQVNTGYIAQPTAQRAAADVRNVPLVDGAAPALLETVASQDVTSRQTEPRITVFAPDPRQMAGFGRITTVDGRTVSLAGLPPGSTYLNKHATTELGARTGDTVLLFAGTRATPMRVAGIVRYDGAATTGSAALMPLPEAQRLLGRPGQVSNVLVSNEGGALSGAAHTDAVMASLDRMLPAYGLAAAPVKHDGIRAADKSGASFVSLFTTFGMFSISAGILLIFLIFVMLAAERRSETGVARAVGMQRRHVVQAFVIEGAVYDIGAALVGALLGVLVAWGMVAVLTSALGSQGLTIRHYVQASSVFVGYALGVVITLLVVAVSAWRVSRLNIVTAIRNLTDPPHGRRSTVVIGIVLIVLGALFTLSGIASAQATGFLLGVSFLLIGVVPVLTARGVPERPVYTAAGIALVVWWLLPFGLIRAMIPDISMNFSVWVVGGLMIVLGASWTIMYNADVVLTGVAAALRRVRPLAPIAKTSMAYPLRSRFRTGMTLAMFTLVVFTLVVGATTTNAFTKAVDNVGTYGGGFDVRAETTPVAPITDMRAALAHAPGVRPQDFRTVAAQSYLPVDAVQAGTRRARETYVVRGLDDAYLDNTTYGLATMAKGYTSARQVWQAIRTTPGLAVVDPLVVPHRNAWNFGNLPAFRLSGFFIEDTSFAPVPVRIGDPRTGTGTTLRVIGVLKETAALSNAGLLTSQRTLAPFGDRARPTVYFFKLAPGVDARATARTLESAFLANGMQADAIGKLLSDGVAANLTMNRLVLGFIGLGLVVGVAALGVISARAVVERRQHIGVLRAIGFQQRMVQVSFLLESAFVSITAIVLGTFLGLLCARNVIADTRSQGSWSQISFAVPWVELLTIFAVVLVAALATTYAPARRAARVYPAEALRYQ